MTQVRFSVDVVIHRPPDAVFAVMADPARLPDWQPRVVEARVVDGGPVRAGVRILEVRQVGRRRVEQLVEVVEHDPPRRFALQIVEGPVPIDGDVTLTPVDGGAATAVRLVAHGELRGVQRLLAPLLTRFGRREMRGQYERLKRLLEAP